MENFIMIAVVAVIIGLAGGYIHKGKSVVPGALAAPMAAPAMESAAGLAVAAGIPIESDQPAAFPFCG